MRGERTRLRRWAPIRAALLAGILSAGLSAGILGCGDDGAREAAVAGSEDGADAAGFSAPSAQTAAANAAFAADLALEDRRDFEDAERGLIERDPDQRVVTAAGRVFSQADYAFLLGDLAADAPPSVNPSLWRQAQLNGLHGLYRVAEGIYQVRGYDLANLSWIRGETGWIVVDPLSSVEAAQAAVALARRHLGDDPIRAIVFTHSHVDHFQGVAGLLSDAGGPEPMIIAPARFVEEVTSENILAGTAMGRRATYQFGFGLPYGERGFVDSGLGKQPVTGTSSFAAPTVEIDRTPQPMTIDGVEFVFQYVPESEAPAELAFYLPAQRAWCGAEIVSHTMHNLYTLRGAKVRDARRWSGYVDDAIQRFPDAEVVFMSHHWPVFGRERVLAFLKNQRDVYRFIHDQTLRLANQGATPREIAETLELPPTLARDFGNRGYYGTLRHNTKAVYQFYLGWYDGNPANLDPLPPAELGRRYVDAIGGAAAVKEKARAAIASGDYRFAATLLDHLVFADERDDEAKRLLAGAYDQLGYQAESGVWRSEYLTAADELRRGIGRQALDARAASALLERIPTELFFSAMATRLDGERAGQRDPLTINFVFTDSGETWVLNVENAVLHHWPRPADPAAAATVRLTRAFFLRLITGQAGLTDLLLSGDVDVDGSRAELLAFFGLLDGVAGNFPIVTP